MDMGGISSSDPADNSEHSLNKSDWLEVSLTVEPELVEPVAEVLSRFAPRGVAIESTAVFADECDNHGATVGPLKVVAYLSIDEHIEYTRQRLEESLWYLSRIRPLPEPQYRSLNDLDWAEAWKEHYQPIPIGDRLIIVPAWLDMPAKDRIPIIMDPGMAFGTGTHPTTFLCLQILEEMVDLQDKDVIDIGCGSGILAIAAGKLGARKALAVDNDQLAINVARANLALNQVSDDIILGVGSIEEIKHGTYSFSKAHVILANILAPVLIRMLDQGLGRRLLPGGVLILSGIIEDQLEELTDAIRRNNLLIRKIKQIDDWVAIVVAHID
jgi:ribosomal protein L11 methyltransferase